MIVKENPVILVIVIFCLALLMIGCAGSDSLKRLNPVVDLQQLQSEKAKVMAYEYSPREFSMNIFRLITGFTYPINKRITTRISKSLSIPCSISIINIGDPGPNYVMYENITLLQKIDEMIRTEIQVDYPEQDIKGLVNLELSAVRNAYFSDKGSIITLPPEPDGSYTVQPYNALVYAQYKLSLRKGMTTAEASFIVSVNKKEAGLLRLDIITPGIIAKPEIMSYDNISEIIYKHVIESLRKMAFAPETMSQLTEPTKKHD